MKALQMTLLHSLFLSSMFMPLYAQQEMDPAWHDPWAKPPATAAPAAKAESPKKLRKASADDRNQGKIRKTARPEPRETARVQLAAGK